MNAINALIAELDAVGDDNAPAAQPIKAKLRAALYEHDRAKLPPVLRGAFDVLSNRPPRQP